MNEPTPPQQLPVWARIIGVSLYFLVVVVVPALMAVVTTGVVVGIVWAVAQFTKTAILGAA